MPLDRPSPHRGVDPYGPEANHSTFSKFRIRLSKDAMTELNTLVPPMLDFFSRSKPTELLGVSDSSNEIVRKGVIFLNDHLAEGGAELSMSKLINALSEDRRFKIAAVLLEGRQSFVLPEDMDLIPFRQRYLFGPYGKFFSLFPDALKLRRLVKSRETELVISFQHRSNFVNVLAKLFGGGHCCIISERVYVRDYYKHKIFGPINRGFLRDLIARAANLMVRALYCNADQITCNAEDTKNSLVSDYGIKRVPIHVIPNGFDQDLILEKARRPVEGRDAHLFSSGKNTIINVGRLCKQKGQDHLLKAFAMMCNKNEYQLILLGKGPWTKYLQELCRNLGIAAMVHFLGYRDNPYAYIARSDCFAFPSLYEGYPNALSEAMICNVPVVAYRFKAGASELLGDGSYGCLVEVGDIQGLSLALRSHRKPSKRTFPEMQEVADKYGEVFMSGLSRRQDSLKH